MATKLCFLAGMFVATVAAQQPQINANGVVNAASNAPVGLPNSAIAQGSIFSIYGTNLGPASSPALAYPLQTTLGGVSVQITSGGTTLNAIPIFVGPKQINAVLPGNTPAGTATVTVTYDGQSSNPASFQVIVNSFGIFTVTNANSQLYLVNSPANPGNVATIWGTGIGASPGDNGSGPPPQIDMPNLPLSVYVGTQPATLTYRGRGGFTGEDQINFVVPAGITDCYVPVAVQIGNITSNFVTMPIAPAGQSCPDAEVLVISSHPLGPTGSVTLERYTTIVNTVTATADSGSAFFGVPYLPVPIPFAAGTCTASPIIYKAILTPGTLDAGPALTVTGPNGSQQITTSGPDYSTAFGPDFLDPGAYTVSAPGGADVGAFSQSLTIPQPLTWTNHTAITPIDRSQPLSVNWTGGDPNSIVQITGSSSGAEFVCKANTRDQSFTIPAFVLFSLPSPSTTATDTLTLSSTSTTPFTASGIMSGTINSIVTIEKNVTYY